AEPPCGPAPCAWPGLTDATAVSTDWAAVAVRPALVRPPRKRRREIPCDKDLATSSRIVLSLDCGRDAIKAPQLSRWGARRLGTRPEIAAEVIGHQPDLFLRPQPAASDHAIDRGLPSAAILPLVAKHRIGMAPEALAHHHAASGMLRALLSAVLPMGRGREQQRRAGERGTDISPVDHCVSLQAFGRTAFVLFQSIRRRIRVGQYPALNLSLWPPLAPVSGAPQERSGNRKARERQPASPIDARNALNSFR